MLKYIVVFAGASLLAISLPAKAQEQRDIVALSSEEIMTPSDTVPRKKTVIVDGVELNEKQLKRYYRQLRKDSIRAHKNIWWSVLGGPSYTPEASFGVGGAVLASFRMNKQDTISQRSFLPAGLNLNRETGEISGIPTAAGTATFTVKAENSEGSDTRALSITVNDAVEQTPVRYLDADGKERFCTEYTVLESVIIEDFFNSDNKWYDMPAGWYVVEGNVTITPRLDTHGAVNLILTNGSHLTAEWGIDVKVGDTFTVYAQSTDEGTMGRLTACLSEDLLDTPYYVWQNYGLPGIGSSTRYRKANSCIYENGGTIIINGGNIRAKGQDKASAIGECGYDTVTQSPSSENRQCGSITINGGIVRTEALTRKTTTGSMGIGSCRSGYGGSVTINGGTVMANAFNDAICTGRGGSITINDGDITARGGLGEIGRGNGIGPS